MPRYLLSVDDNADLIAYLRRLEQDHDPGITGDTVRIGIVLPPNAESTGLGEAIRRLMKSQVEALNEQGGVYHRKLVLRFAVTPNENERRRAVVPEMTSGSEPVFALLAPNLGGADSEIPAAAERASVPLLGVVAPPAPDRPRPGRWVFFLLAGPDDQAIALARLALRDSRPGATVAIVHGPDAGQRALRAALDSRLRSAGLGESIDAELSDAPGSVDALSRSIAGAGVIVVLGTAGRTAELLGSLASRSHGELPTVLFPGTLADRTVFDLPKPFDRRIQLALPMAPSDQTAEGLARFRRLLGSTGPSAGHRTAQLGALAAADVLIEGLRRAERGLTRERFVAELEHLRDFRTGLAPPLTFDPNRHVGSTGTHAITIDLLGHRLLPTGPWIDVEGPLPHREASRTD
jgi:ABC-type branched-subunit amino acid transport system substrate-binding protein